MLMSSIIDNYFLTKLSNHPYSMLYNQHQKFNFLVLLSKFLAKFSQINIMP